MNPTGLWYWPEMNGSGIWLKATDARFYLYWFTFDGDGKQRYHHGGGTRFEMENGFNFVGGGSAKMWIDGDHGKLAYRFGPKRGLYRFQILGRAGNPLDGLYFDESQGGQGCAIQVIPVPQGDELVEEIFCYWFEEDGSWKLATGGKLFSATGGRFMRFDPVEVKPVMDCSVSESERGVVFSAGEVRLNMERLF